jgi:oligopeptide/dipeptide ABC transporter ATP-binding protein
MIETAARPATPPIAAAPAPATEAAAAVLTVTGLSIRFAGGPPDLNLIEDVGFSVAAGRTLCLVGESGCGKSVTALSLMGLLPDAAEVVGGSVRFEGRDMLRISERERADLRGDRIAMIFQEPMTSLNPAFTIGDQIAEGVLRHRGGSKASARARALELLKRVRIPAPEKRLDAYPHQLSGGMRQRVMIAMALANDPKLLVADEPTTALDVTIQAQILSLVKQLQRETGTALVLITHDLGVVAEVADEVAVMYGGLIVERGPVAAVFDDPQHPYTIGLMGSIPSLGRRSAKLATIPGTVPPADRMPRGCRFSTRCPFADARCVAEPPPMRRFGDTHAARCWLAPLDQTFGDAA